MVRSWYFNNKRHTVVDEAGFIDYLEIRQKMKSRAARATCFFDLERVRKCMKTIWKNVLRDVDLE